MELKRFNPWNWVRHEDVPGMSGKLTTRASGQGLGRTHPMMQLHQDIDRLFEEAFQGFGMSPWSQAGSLLEKSGMLKPQVDIAAEDTRYTITVEVPGVDKDAVELELKKDALIIKGEKKQEEETKDKEYYRVERSYGQFQRVLALPEDAEQDNIDASFKDGVLTIVVPRREGAKSEAKHIEIKKES